MDNGGTQSRQQETNRDRDQEHDHPHDRDQERARFRDNDRDHNRERDLGRDRDRYRDRSGDARTRRKSRSRDRGRSRSRSRNRHRSRSRSHNRRRSRQRSSRRQGARSRTPPRRQAARSRTPPRRPATKRSRSSEGASEDADRRRKQWRSHRANRVRGVAASEDSPPEEVNDVAETEAAQERDGKRKREETKSTASDTDDATAAGVATSGVAAADAAAAGVAADADADPEQATWFYLDDTGQERGPYLLSVMSTWFLRGFLPEDVLVRQSHWQIQSQDGEAPVPEWKTVRQARPFFTKMHRPSKKARTRKRDPDAEKDALLEERKQEIAREVAENGNVTASALTNDTNAKVNDSGGGGGDDEADSGGGGGDDEADSGGGGGDDEADSGVDMDIADTDDEDEEDDEVAQQQQQQHQMPTNGNSSSSSSSPSMAHSLNNPENQRKRPLCRSSLKVRKDDLLDETASAVQSLQDVDKKIAELQRTISRSKSLLEHYKEFGRRQEEESPLGGMFGGLSLGVLSLGHSWNVESMESKIEKSRRELAELRAERALIAFGSDKNYTRATLTEELPINLAAECLQWLTIQEVYTLKNVACSMQKICCAALRRPWCHAVIPRSISSRFRPASRSGTNQDAYIQRLGAICPRVRKLRESGRDGDSTTEIIFNNTAGNHEHPDLVKSLLTPRNPIADHIEYLKLIYDSSAHAGIEISRATFPKLKTLVLTVAAPYDSAFELASKTDGVETVGVVVDLSANRASARISASTWAKLTVSAENFVLCLSIVDAAHHVDTHVASVLDSLPQGSLPSKLFVTLLPSPFTATEMLYGIAIGTTTTVKLFEVIDTRFPGALVSPEGLMTKFLLSASETWKNRCEK